MWADGAIAEIDRVMTEMAARSQRNFLSRRNFRVIATTITIKVQKITQQGHINSFEQSWWIYDHVS